MTMSLQNQMPDEGPRDIDWARDGEFFYPSDETMGLLDEVSGYLNARNPERWYKKEHPSPDELSLPVKLAMGAALGIAACGATVVMNGIAMGLGNVHY
jgi:hypothetical protein